jgi:hypothetical protein
MRFLSALLYRPNINITQVALVNLQYDRKVFDWCDKSQYTGSGNSNPNKGIAPLLNGESVISQCVPSLPLPSPPPFAFE